MRQDIPHATEEAREAAAAVEGVFEILAGGDAIEADQRGGQDDRQSRGEPDSAGVADSASTAGCIAPQPLQGLVDAAGGQPSTAAAPQMNAVAGVEAPVSEPPAPISNGQVRGDFAKVLYIVPSGVMRRQQHSGVYQVSGRGLQWLQFGA